MILKLGKSKSGLVIVGAMDAIAPKLLRKKVNSTQNFKEKVIGTQTFEGKGYISQVIR